MGLLVITPILMIVAPFVTIATVRSGELTRDNAQTIFFSTNKVNLLCYIVLPLLLLGLYLKSSSDMSTLMLFQSQQLIIFGAIAALKDYREHIVPNRLILMMFVVWVITMISELFISVDSAMLHLMLSSLGFFIGGGVFLIVYAASKKGLGGGDVKLMAVFGLYLTIYRVLAVMLYGTLLAAIVGISLVLLKKIGRKDSIPLVPFLYAGLIVALALL